MKKSLLSLFAMLLTVLLTSCGDVRTTPQAIGDFEFTGEGILGNVPYIIAYYNRNYDEKDKEEGKKYQTIFQDMLKDIDGKEIPYERHIDGKIEEVKGVKLKTRWDGWVFNTELEYPEGYKKVNMNYLIALDKDGSPLAFGDQLYLGDRRLKLELLLNDYMREYTVERAQYIDRIAKLVDADKEGKKKLQELAEQKKNEKLAEEAKKNDLSKCEFTGMGYGPIKLSEKLTSVPQKMENLYTHYYQETEEQGEKIRYVFYNGEEEVAYASAFKDNKQIIEIVIVSDKITVKSDDGKAVKVGMKISDVIKLFQDNCYVAWTGDDVSPVLHFGDTMGYVDFDDIFTPSYRNKLADIEGSYDDTMPVKPQDVKADMKLDGIYLGY